jgi:hypothetical protein
MSACFDSSISTSRGLTIPASARADEMNDDLETLKWRLRLVISFRATALSMGHPLGHDAEISLNF